MKCINCIYCNVSERKCRPKSQDCNYEYILEENDLFTEKRCDFARKKGENIIYYYMLQDIYGKMLCIKTKYNLKDFSCNKDFLKKVAKENGVNIINISNIYELTEKEYGYLKEEIKGSVLFIGH